MNAKAKTLTLATIHHNFINSWQFDLALNGVYTMWCWLLDMSVRDRVHGAHHLICVLITFSKWMLVAIAAFDLTQTLHGCSGRLGNTSISTGV